MLECSRRDFRGQQEVVTCFLFVEYKCQVEFGVNAEAQKFLSRSGETLTAAVNNFTSDVNTLLNKTIEDTMMNAKQYEAVRCVEATLPVSCRGCTLSSI